MEGTEFLFDEQVEFPTDSIDGGFELPANLDDLEKSIEASIQTSLDNAEMKKDLTEIEKNIEARIQDSLVDKKIEEKLSEFGSDFAELESNLQKSLETDEPYLFDNSSPEKSDAPPENDFLVDELDLSQYFKDNVGGDETSDESSDIMDDGWMGPVNTNVFSMAQEQIETNQSVARAEVLITPHGLDLDKYFAKGSFCPVWYSNLNKKGKEKVRNMVKGKAYDADLIQILQKELKLQKKDATNFLDWWFHKKAKKNKKKKKKADPTKIESQKERGWYRVRYACVIHCSGKKNTNKTLDVQDRVCVDKMEEERAICSKPVNGWCFRSCLVREVKNKSFFDSVMRALPNVPVPVPSIISGGNLSFRVIGDNGVTVRATKELDSKKIELLPLNTVLKVECIRGRRCKIIEPVVGWCSIKSKAGDKFLEKISTTEHDLEQQRSLIEQLEDKIKALEITNNLLVGNLGNNQINTTLQLILRERNQNKNRYQKRKREILQELANCKQEIMTQGKVVKDLFKALDGFQKTHMVPMGFE